MQTENDHSRTHTLWQRAAYRSWQPREGSPRDLRSHTSCLLLSVLWRALTHYKTLERSHLISGLGFIFHTAKHLGSMFSQIYPMILNFLYLLCSGGQTPCQSSSYHPCFQEGGGLLRAQPHGAWGRSSGIGRSLGFPGGSRLCLSLSARYDQAYSGHTACLPAKSWGDYSS